MRRDLNFCREILLRVADRESGSPVDLSFPDRTDDELISHLVWLEEADLLVADFFLDHRGMPTGADVERLTWEGCDFLDAARDPSLWQKAQQKFLSPGVSYTFEIVKAWLKKEILGELPDLGTPN